MDGQVQLAGRSSRCVIPAPAPAPASAVAPPTTNTHLLWRGTHGSSDAAQPSPPPPPSSGYGEEDHENRDFYLSVLKSSSTKREARTYIQRYEQKPTHTTVDSGTIDPSLLPAAATGAPRVDHKSRTAAYIKRLLSRQQKIAPADFETAASSAAAFFTPEIEEDQVHLALVKIRQVQDVDDETLAGICKTLVKLKKLGLLPAVVIDPSTSSAEEGRGAGLGADWRADLQRQAERVVAAIERGKGQARAVDGACSVKSGGARAEEEVTVALPNLIIAPLSRGVIPVIAPVAYDCGHVATAVNADSIVLALTRLLGSVEEIRPEPNTALSEPSLLSVDRIIYIDPLGGTPSFDRPNGSAHVFLNLQQEYDSVRQELLQPKPASSSSSSSASSSEPTKTTAPISTPKNALSPTGIPLPVGKPPSPFFHPERTIHLQNLTTLRTALSLLPSTSSAMITTPEAAAVTPPPRSTSWAPKPTTSTLTTSSKTPMGRNPLIHNLLTDKPVFSSSLPISSPTSPYTTPTTLLKHGIPLSIITNPAYPPPGHKMFNLDDGTIDWDRLVYLIEDSFGRKLDVERYLRRVRDNIAGVIIAGEYEGAAIVTWETTGVPPNAASSPPPKPPPRILYLDKFAVLRRSQGAGGVADVVFKAMVMGMFPGEGIVWRSRQENVVNKWYFERAKGSWKVPGTGWTMFWTGGEEVVRDDSGGGKGSGMGKGNMEGRDGTEKGRFAQSVGICRGVEASFFA
ncbi:hypothetical protein DFH27DRAFT_607513 [Peziza echinospora]|nr:hypothetical protein DFH27DRAFT_607513 [Peziza echinospora]